jgi:hypothetical protein
VSDAPPTLLDRLGSSAQNLALIIAVGISALNAWFYIFDRDAKAAKEVFDNQVTITKLYFERLANLQGKEWCREAAVVAEAATILARMSLDDALAAGRDKALAAKLTGEQRLAVALVTNFDKRRFEECQGGLSVAAGGGGIAYAEPLPGLAAASYTPPQGAAGAPQRPAVAPAPVPAPAPTPTPGAVPVNATFTLYIQYQAGTPGEAVAREIRTKVGQGLVAEGTRFLAPGAEAVKQVPSRDQIRIYRDEDEPRARAIAKALNLADIQVVSLARAYRNLPANTMELWLKGS